VLPESVGGDRLRALRLPEATLRTYRLSRVHWVHWVRVLTDAEEESLDFA
jgi:hypothetical protein